MEEMFWQRSKAEYDICTANVNPTLKKYIEENVFPKYEKNDKAHGIIHILEVIRRSFVLNSEMNLGLDTDMIYAISACHDIGKYIDSDNHHMIAGKSFFEDEGMKQFFSEGKRQTIREAIEDHRSSKEDSPRSDYGKLVSSADRNTRIEMVFIRSFFVAKAKMPNDGIEEYLDFTIKRLRKRYSTENPENMFFEDEEYRTFLADMRAILADEKRFKDTYCAINHIENRNSKVCENAGETAYSFE